MKKGAITQIYNSCLAECGNDHKKAGVLMRNKIENLLKEDKLNSADFNFAQMAQELIPDFESMRTASAQDVVNTIMSSHFPTLSGTVINREILKSYQSNMEGLDALVSEGQASRTTMEQLAGFTDSEGPEMRLEGMPYEETLFGEKSVQVYMADFGRMISITREALFNDRTGQLLDQARKIGDKAGIHRAKMIAQTLEVAPRTAFKEPTGGSRAFVYKGTAVQVADFYAATHATLDGRVNKNLITSNGLADYRNIQAAMKAFGAYKDYNGDEIVVKPDTLIIHPDNEVLAWQIVNTASFAAVGTAGSITPVHVSNPYGPGGLAKFNIVSSRYLATPTTWYLGKPKDQMIWLWVYKPATESLTASAEKAFTNNIVVQYKFSYHGGCGHSDYLNVVKNTQ